MTYSATSPSTVPDILITPSRPVPETPSTPMSARRGKINFKTPSTPISAHITEKTVELMTPNGIVYLKFTEDDISKYWVLKNENSEEACLALFSGDDHLIKFLDEQEIIKLAETANLKIKFVFPSQFDKYRNKFETEKEVLEASKKEPSLIILLTAAEIAALEPEQIQALTGSQISCLSEEQMQALTGSQISWLSEEQMQVLKKDQIKALIQKAELKVDQISKLSETIPDFIKLLGSDQIRALTPEQIKALEPEQIKALKTEQIQALQPWQIKALKKAQIQALQPWQIWALTEEQIRALRQNDKLNEVDKVLEVSKQNPCLIRLLTKDEIQALIQPQIQALTIAQIRGLKKEQIFHLTGEQLKALRQPQIRALRQNYELNEADKVVEVSKRITSLLRLIT